MAEKIIQIPKISEKRTLRKKNAPHHSSMVFNEEYDDVLGFNLDSKGHFLDHFKDNCSLLRKNPYYGLYEWIARKIQHPEIIAEWIRLDY